MASVALIPQMRPANSDGGLRLSTWTLNCPPGVTTWTFECPRGHSVSTWTLSAVSTWSLVDHVDTQYRPPTPAPVRSREEEVCGDVWTLPPVAPVAVASPFRSAPVRDVPVPRSAKLCKVGVHYGHASRGGGAAGGGTGGDADGP
ncbi:hypothetical protein THAOC_03632, partial [Thalassiosira oceanica]